MQIQRHDITGRQRVLRQGRQEEFINDARTGDADPTLGCPGGMRCHNEPTPHPLRPQRQVRTVVEGTYHPAFWVSQVLIRGQFQTSLDLGAF